MSLAPVFAQLVGNRLVSAQRANDVLLPAVLAMLVRNHNQELFFFIIRVRHSVHLCLLCHALTICRRLTMTS